MTIFHIVLRISSEFSLDRAGNDLAAKTRVKSEYSDERSERGACVADIPLSWRVSRALALADATINNHFDA